MHSKDYAAWLGSALIAALGVVHLYNSQTEFKEATYLGIFFLAQFIVATIASIGIYRGAFWWGWEAGLILTVSTFVGYVLSRTFGLPNGGVEAWGPLAGYLSMALEIAFVGLYLTSGPLYYLVLPPQKISIQSQKHP